MFQAPSLTAIMTAVLGIAAIGAALDKLVLSNRLEIWRRKIGELWIKLNTPKAQGLTRDANQMYCDMFDYIYGSKPLSRRRVYASVLSSVIALFFISLLLGYQNTIWADFFHDALNYGIDWELLLFIFILPVILNLLPDFLSLIETRLVLRWSCERDLLGILFFIFLDLVLTTTLFTIGFSIWILAGAGISTKDFLEYLISGKLMKDIITVDQGLVFFLTTFVTSLFWILFVLTFGIIWLFHRIIPLAKFVYYEIGQSDRPVLAISAFLNSIIIIIYVLWKLLEKVVGS